MPKSGRSIGVSGVIRLIFVFFFVAANLALYTILPIASLGLLPMIIACITLVSSTLDELGLN